MFNYSYQRVGLTLGELRLSFEYSV